MFIKTIIVSLGISIFAIGCISNDSTTVESKDTNGFSISSLGFMLGFGNSVRISTPSKGADVELKDKNYYCKISNLSKDTDPAIINNTTIVNQNVDNSTNMQIKQNIDNSTKTLINQKNNVQIDDNSKVNSDNKNSSIINDSPSGKINSDNTAK